MKLTAVLFHFLFVGVLEDVLSVIISSYVVPHGGIALDPNHFNTSNKTAKQKAWALHDAYVKVGEDIGRSNPEIVFLSTPHGISDLNNFLFYLNPKGSGYADTDNCNCPPCCYNVTVNLASDLSNKLVNVLGAKRNVSGLSGFGPPGQSDEPFPLRWGEVIPLHFLPNINKTRVMILSQPSRRYTEDVKMIPELISLGAELYNYLQNLQQSVVVIISADLAHTHSKDGPYGYSDSAQPFDDACGQWARTLDKTSLLVTAASYVDKALSCGYTGLVMLHGLLAQAGLSSWKPQLYANYHPSYYGMMIASFKMVDRCMTNADPIGCKGS